MWLYYYSHKGWSSMNKPYSVLFSNNRIGFPYIRNRLEEIINPDSKVVIIPWAYIFVDNGYIDTSEYFPRYGARYERELWYLREIGIEDKNVYIADYYADTPDRIKTEIENSDIIILPGGNPVSLKDKICELKLDEILRSYKNNIIGGSAGATTQFGKYFITEEQNEARGFQELDGMGLLDVDFMIDVHTDVYTSGEYEGNKEKYYSVLQQLANKYRNNIFGIYENGAILVNRENREYETFGDVKCFSYQG